MSKRLLLLRFGLLALAASAIVLGAMNGEIRTVVTKAINVCLECIGIG